MGTHTMMVKLIDEFSAISSQEFKFTISNTPPKFLIPILPNIRVQMNMTVEYDLSLIKDDEDNPITIKVCDLNNPTSVSTYLTPQFIEIN
jgi:hypothetical protein